MPGADVIVTFLVQKWDVRYKVVFNLLFFRCTPMCVQAQKEEEDNIVLSGKSTLLKLDTQN